MSVWDTYKGRVDAHGSSKRNAIKIREIRSLNTKLPDSLSYQTVDIFPCGNGFNITDPDVIASYKKEQNVAIIRSDNYDEKTMISLPGEDIELGSLVSWMNQYWLVIERDPNTTLYTRTKLLMCNHLLKWVNADHKIIEQWCAVRDGTKYLSGELEDQRFIVTRGDARVSMQIARNEHTVVLNRQSRFLIDDEDTPHKLSFTLTKPMKKGQLYNKSGTYLFVLQEGTATEYDNHELGIADYYKHFPLPATGNTKPDHGGTNQEGKKVWL